MLDRVEEISEVPSGVGSRDIRHVGQIIRFMVSRMATSAATVPTASVNRPTPPSDTHDESGSSRCSR
jgi:hypothetical protein